VTLKASHTPWDEALARIDPARFEALLADHYRSCGWQVEEVGADFTGQRYDRGFDLELRRDDAYVIVQCKRWRAFQVPQHEVRELHAVMVNEAATGAVYVTTGEFTAAAIDAAARIGQVELVDGERLRTMIDATALESAARDSPPPMYAHPQLTLSAGSRSRPMPRRGLLVPALTLAACVVVCAGVVHSLNAMVRPGPRLTATRGARIPPLPDDRRSRAALPLVDPYSLAGAAPPARRVEAGARAPVKADPIAPTATRRLDREAARAAVRPLGGVQSAFWLDDNDLVVVVARGRAGSGEMIATVCAAIEPLGDTSSIIVDLQEATSRKAGDAIISGACASPGEVANIASDASRRAR
jgi:hypothetical protein